jgi:hypothetical protein
VGRKHIIEVLIVGLWLAIAVVLGLRYSQPQQLPIPEELVAPVLPRSEQGKMYEISRIIVLRGDAFDITLKNESRVLVRLSVAATENARGKVLDLLNHSTNPRAKLIERQPDGRWTIDLLFVYQGNETDLAKWLETNNLVYQ